MKTTVINGVPFMLGGIHFVATFVAEHSATAEAELKHKYLGMNAKAVCQERINTTYARIDRVNSLFKSKEQVQCEQVLIEASAS